MADINQTPPISGLASVHSREQGRNTRHHGAHADDQPAQNEPGADERDIDVQITLMGIPEEEATPSVREALAKVMGEYDRQRADLERVQLRATYLEEQQDRDPVLPVAGRLALLRRLSAAVHRSEQSAMTNALIVFHFIGLHEVRMSAGRPVAEALMTDIARQMQDSLRQTDFLASLGGYDMGLLLPLANAADAEAKARTIVAGIEDHAFDAAGQAVSLRVEWGVVTFGEKGDPQAVLDQADADLMLRR